MKHIQTQIDLQGRDGKWTVKYLPNEQTGHPKVYVYLNGTLEAFYENVPIVKCKNPTKTQAMEIVRETIKRSKK